MEVGKNLDHSPILDAIEIAENSSFAQIHVYISKNWFERNAFKRAGRLFYQYGLHTLNEQKSVLIYVNLRRKKFAILGDQNVDQTFGQNEWDNLGHSFSVDLRATQSEKAISLAVLDLGELLKKHFPKL